MDPFETGRRYDRIVAYWDREGGGRRAGFDYLQRAIELVSERRRALDVGCGNGRMSGILAAAGFRVTGVDVSEEMLRLARSRHPQVEFVRADICRWQSPEDYDLIVAWDSTFHVPHDRQAATVRRLRSALVHGGILLFTAGDGDGETTGKMDGVEFYYSSLTESAYRALLRDSGCTCILSDHDQLPERHVVFIARKDYVPAVTNVRHAVRPSVPSQ